jgi:hypothetical protein
LKFCEIIIIVLTLVHCSRTYDKERKIVGKTEASEIELQGFLRRVPVMKEEGINCMSTGNGRMESCRGRNYLLF